MTEKEPNEGWSITALAEGLVIEVGAVERALRDVTPISFEDGIARYRLTDAVEALARSPELKQSRRQVTEMYRKQAEKEKAELAELKASLVPASALEEGRREIFEAYAAAMRSFPAERAGKIAAELGIDPDALREFLEEQVEIYIREREAELFGPR